MHKIATLAVSFLFVGCATTGPDLAVDLATASNSLPELQSSVDAGAASASLAANAQSATSAIAELEQIETVSVDEIVEGGEQTVCRYEKPIGSRIARKRCYIADPIDEALDELVTRETVEYMRDHELLRQRAELERTMRGQGGLGGR